MKVRLSLILAFVPLSLVCAQTSTFKKGGSAVDNLAPPAPANLKDSVTVDISDSAIANDFELKEVPPLLTPVKEKPTKEESRKDKGALKKQALPADIASQAEGEPESDPAAPADPAPEQPEGVLVKVEPGKNGGSVDAAQIKLLAPFPPKALAKPPAGWRVENPENVPPIVQEVMLDNGAQLKLTIRPHVLVPDADGSQVIATSEPGFDPALQYAQTKTVGAILSGSLDRMDKDSKDLGDALERLQQLLGSLPHPAPQPAAASTGRGTESNRR